MDDSTSADHDLQAAMATIMFVDVVESVRHVQHDEQGAIRRMRELMALAASLVRAQDGQVIERLGDGLVLRFPSAREAVRCATAMHRLADGHSANLPEPAQLKLRAGVHSASIWASDSGLYGLGVNLAARVAALGRPTDTLLSSAARDQLVVGLDGDMIDLGDCYLKHVAEPVRIFRHRPQAEALPADLRLAIAERLRALPVLAILPFDDGARAVSAAHSLAGGPGDVVADQLAASLGRTAPVHVICALSALALRGREFDLGQLYRLLGADYLLLGRLDLDAGGQSIKLQASLWRRGAGDPVHELTLHGRTVELLAHGSELLGRLAQEVATRIVQIELRTGSEPAALPNLSSHTLYLNAVTLMHRFSASDFDRARHMFEALAERAPRHAQPLAWLARWHVFRVVQGWTHDRQRDSQQAMDYSRRALDLDPESSLAHTMAGTVHAGVHRDPAAASRSYDEALRHNPNEALAWLMKGVSDGFMARRSDALAASETALGLSPVDPMSYYYSALGASAALSAGVYERAVVLAERAITHNRSHGSAYRTLAIAAHQLGRTEVARETVRNLLLVEPQASLRLFRARSPGSNPLHEDFAESLRASGLPEE